MRRTTERLSKDEEQFLDYARNLSEIERQALAEVMVLLKENPDSGNLIDEAMRKGFWESSAIVHYVKRELTRRRLTVIDGGAK